MATNVKSFTLALQRWGETRPVEMVLKAQKRIALIGLRSLVFMTPVDTGRARSNWQVAVNTPSVITPFQGGKRVRDGGDQEENGALAAESSLGQSSKINKVKRNQIIWISNSVPYILVLEGPPGSSPQAPEGMLGPTVARLKTMF